MSNNKKNTVSIYTPKTLDFNYLFGSRKDIDQHRFRFLIYHINYWTNKDGASRTSRDDMKDFLKVSPAKLKLMYNFLITEKIIYQSEERVASKDKDQPGKNAGYSMLKPFDQADANVSTEYIYDLKSTDTPDFIKHWYMCKTVVKPMPKDYKTKAVKLPSYKVRFEQALAFIAASGLDYKPLYTSSEKYRGVSSTIGYFENLSSAEILEKENETLRAEQQKLLIQQLQAEIEALRASKQLDDTLSVHVQPYNN